MRSLTSFCRDSFIGTRGNLPIWNVAINCTLIARSTFVVSPRCTLVYRPRYKHLSRFFILIFNTLVFAGCGRWTMDVNARMR
jgi:hypothetical protein